MPSSSSPPTAPASSTPRLTIISRRPSILDRTNDFVTLFVHHAGEFETPRTFLEWGAISLIASCVAERCYQYFFRRSKLLPNLYTFLLADSGVGKGNTCNLVTSYLKQPKHKILTGLEESRTTAQGVMDRLGGRFSKPGSVLAFLNNVDPEKGGEAPENPLALIETEEDEAFRLAAQRRIFLVFEELALSIGSGQRADDFVKFLTKVFGGQGFVDRTRTFGEIDLGEEVCLNVLAGSTHRWLKDCVTLDSVLGGFFARCIVIDGDADRVGKRYWRPKYPWDTDLVRQHLQNRVDELVQVSGEFRLTHEADEIGEKWYMERPDPEDPMLGPIFRRERATVLKLAHLFALSEGLFNKGPKTDLRIHGRHMARAQEAIRRLGPAIMRVVAHSSITKDTRGLLELREFIRENQPVSHNASARYMSSIGVGGEQLRQLFAMLRDAGELETLIGSKGKKQYALTEGTRTRANIFADVDDETEGSRDESSSGIGIDDDELVCEDGYEDSHDSDGSP